MTHYLPLVAVYDTSVWPPRDSRSIKIIQEILSSRPQATDVSYTPHLRSHDRKRMSACGVEAEVIEQGDNEGDSFISYNKNTRRQRKRKIREMGKNQSLASNSNFQSSDQQGRKSLRITVDGHDGNNISDRYSVSRRRAEEVPHQQPYTNEYHQSPLKHSQPLLHSPSPSFRRDSNAHHVSTTPHLMEDRPFPRTPHNYRNQDQKQQRRQSTEQPYSLNQSQRWREKSRDQDWSRQFSHDHSNPSFRSSPSTPTPSLLPSPGTPSTLHLRSYSSQSHQSQPIPFHRHLSEPHRTYSAPSSDSGTPSSWRSHVTHSGGSMISSRDFRKSGNAVCYNDTYSKYSKNSFRYDRKNSRSERY